MQLSAEEARQAAEELLRKAREKREVGHPGCARLPVPGPPGEGGFLLERASCCRDQHALFLSLGLRRLLVCAEGRA